MNIAITGEGIVSAIGTGKDEVLRSLLERRSGIGRMRHLQSTHTELPVGEVPLSNADMKRQLGISADREVSRTVLMGMLAIRQALDEAGVGQRRQGRRVALINGTTVGGMDITEQHFGRMAQGLDADCLRQHDGGGSSCIMAKNFDLFDEVTTISTACSSAANAILLGARLLKSGEADMVVCGGTEALSRFHLNGFNSLMILDHEPCRPFDATRAGLNLGEGAAFIVMESQESALKRGATVHGWLTGYGNACDAFHQTASSANGEGAYRAMRQALDMAGLGPADIDYVNAHGTGTPDNDRSESAALGRVFADRLPPVSSTKAFTGHTTSASGSIEAVVCLLALRHGFIPANLGWREAMPDGLVPSQGTEGVSLTHVLSNSFGFGGNDTSLVFSSQPKTTPDGEDACSREPRILARVEIDSDEQLADIRRYVKPLEARRMGRLMKAAMLTSLQALEKAGIEVPDAIVTGTRFGCLDNSERLLQQIELEGEAATSPTYFMQSTHNTIGSAVAIKTGCHGYNCTYTQGRRSLDCAVRDARLLLMEGRCKTVLVGCHDESTPLFRELMEKATGEQLPALHSVALVMSC